MPQPTKYPFLPDSHTPSPLTLFSTPSYTASANKRGGVDRDGLKHARHSITHALMYTQHNPAHDLSDLTIHPVLSVWVNRLVGYSSNGVKPLSFFFSETPLTYLNGLYPSAKGCMQQ